MGNNQVKGKNYRRAISYYTKAIELHKDGVYYANRSLCYFKLEEYEKALQDCFECVKLKPDYFITYVRISAIMIKFRRIQESYD